MLVFVVRTQLDLLAHVLQHDFGVGADAFEENAAAFAPGRLHHDVATRDGAVGRVEDRNIPPLVEKFDHVVYRRLSARRSRLRCQPIQGREKLRGVVRAHDVSPVLADVEVFRAVTQPAQVALQLERREGLAAARKPDEDDGELASKLVLSMVLAGRLGDGRTCDGSVVVQGQLQAAARWRALVCDARREGDAAVIPHGWPRRRRRRVAVQTAPPVHRGVRVGRVRPLRLQVVAAKACGHQVVQATDSPDTARGGLPPRMPAIRHAALVGEPVRLRRRGSIVRGRPA